MTTATSRPITVTDEDLFTLCGLEQDNTLHRYLFRLMQEEATAVASTLVSPPSTMNGLTNGHVPTTTTGLSEEMVRDRINTMYNNARAVTRVVYERGIGEDGENWIVRMLIFNALVRLEATTESSQTP